MVNQTTNMDRE